MAECTCADPTMVAASVMLHSNQQVLSRTENTMYLDQTLSGNAMGSPHGASSPTRFCHWAAPEYGGIGESIWTNLFQAAALAIAIANGVAQSQIADMQQDMADRYYNMAKYKWERFQNNYMPLEKQLLGEVSNTPVRNIDCIGARDRANSATGMAYDNADTYMTRMLKAYRLCLDDSYNTYMGNRRNTMLVDTENYNLSDERWFTDMKNDQRWNRRSNVLNLGRNLSSEALKYGDVARSIAKQVGAQIDRAAGGMVQALGYYGARNDTFYPTTYMNSAGGLNTQLVNISTPTSINPGGINPTGGF